MNRNELKTVSKTDDTLRVANYILLFGGRDLTGEFFTKNTAIESAYTKSGVLHVDFEHGLDPDKVGMSADDVLGYVDWKTAQVDDTGVFVERVLNRGSKYMAVLERLIDAGLVGNYSESVRGQSERGEDGEIKRWPLARDTLTFTPAEPRMLTGNTLKAARELYRAYPDSKSLAILDDIADYKSEIENAENLKNIEALLRDAGGFSRADAKALISRIKSLSQCDSDTKTANAAMAGVLESIQQTHSILTSRYTL